MKPLATIVFVAALSSGCGNGSETAGATSAVPLPSQAFELVCQAGKGQPPTFAVQEFRIRVDPKMGTYQFSHWTGEMPIKTMEPAKIVFIDEVIEKGRDNNPEIWRIRYDARSRKLDYRESFSGFVHTDYAFTSECQIV
jgi:hypothetical protein